MGEVKQINIKSRTYHFYNDMTNLKNFDLKLLKIDWKHYNGIAVGDCENIHSVNPLYLLVNHVSGYIEQKMEIITWFLMILLMKTKHHLKYAQMFGMELKTKSK